MVQNVKGYWTSTFDFNLEEKPLRVASSIDVILQNKVVLRVFLWARLLLNGNSQVSRFKSGVKLDRQKFI
jgi:hypothetical protein